MSFDSDKLARLRSLATSRRMSLSQLSRDLILRALELEEDRFFSEVGDSRLKKKTKTIKHEDFWD